MNKALLVGINLYPSGRLLGSVNDVLDMREFLVSACGFQNTDIRMLVDNEATRQAIIEGLGWLLADIKPGDRLLFQFSGHGLRIPKGVAVDGYRYYDKAVCPHDFDWDGANTICDKEFAKMFVNIPDGASFVWISDSCHSGELVKMAANNDGGMPPIITVQDAGLQKTGEKDNGTETPAINGDAKSLNLALIAACSAYQKADDMYFDNRPNGVFTYFLLQELRTQGGLEKPLCELVTNICQNLLQHRYSQVPQIVGPSTLKNKAFLAV